MNTRRPTRPSFASIARKEKLRWCIGAVAASIDATHRVVRLGGVTVDITDRKSAEERQTLLVREVDHRARNALAVVQSIVRLTRAESKEAYIAAVEGRITALSRAHVLLSESRWQGANLSRLLDEELAPYCRGEMEKIVTNGSLPRARNRANTRSHPARTGDQRRQVRSAFIDRWQSEAVLAGGPEPAGVAVGRDRWPACPAAAFRGLWH